MGQAQPLAGWCWVFSVVHAQMGPRSYIELRVWRCRTNRRAHHSDMPRTSGTHRNTWTYGFGCRHTMLAEYHHCQHLKMWNPYKRRKRRRPTQALLISIIVQLKAFYSALLESDSWSASMPQIRFIIKPLELM